MSGYRADNGVAVYCNDTEVANFAADKLIGEIFGKSQALYTTDDINAMKKRARRFASVYGIANAIFDEADNEELQEYFGGRA